MLQRKGANITETFRDCPFSVQEIKDALNKGKGSWATAARALNQACSNRGIKATAQLLRYWESRFDESDRTDGYDRARNLVRTRNAQTENNRLRRDQRALSDAIGTRDAFYDSLAMLVDGMGTRPPVEHKRFVGVQAGIPMTVELLFSDLQIGKLAHGYNTPTAKLRVREYTRAALFQIEQKIALGYRVERILLAIIGDIIESDKKHKNSARACDTGTAEQMWDAQEVLFYEVIEPLARLGIKLDIVCVTGNHDWDDHGINMFEPGKTHLSYPLYKGLEMVTKRAGYGLFTDFYIPDGSYQIMDIYGQHILYEHGVGVSVGESPMKSHKIKRAEQEKKHLRYFRMGDKHNVSSFNSGAYVVNGAFFGAGKGGKEYSGIVGFDSVPAQWMGFHVPRTDERMSLYDTFTIQLDHIEA